MSVCTYKKYRECIFWKMWYIHIPRRLSFISINKKASNFLQKWNWDWKEIEILFCTFEMMMEWRFHKFILEHGARGRWEAMTCIAGWKAHTWVGRNSPRVSLWSQGYLINGRIYEQIKALILGERTSWMAKLQ